jgi:hypothetical protein
MNQHSPVPCDDCNAPSDTGWTLAARIEEEADRFEEYSSQFGTFMGGQLRTLAASVRAKGLLTEDQVFAAALKG